MIYLIHGAYGNPSENWFPWLTAELKKKGHTVIIPQFPTPVGQTLENWNNEFLEYEVDDDTIFVGHSIGVAFVLSILERHKVKAAFLVAGFCSPLGNNFDAINKTFVDREFDWETIRHNCENFYVFNSDNDPYVRLEKGAELAASVRSELIIVKNAGHFNLVSGYTKFPMLLEKINAL